MKTLPSPVLAPTLEKTEMEEEGGGGERGKKRRALRF